MTSRGWENRLVDDRKPPLIFFLSIGLFLGPYNTFPIEERTWKINKAVTQNSAKYNASFQYFMENNECLEGDNFVGESWQSFGQVTKIFTDEQFYPTTILPDEKFWKRKNKLNVWISSMYKIPFWYKYLAFYQTTARLRMIQAEERPKIITSGNDTIICKVKTIFMLIYQNQSNLKTCFKWQS